MNTVVPVEAQIRLAAPQQRLINLLWRRPARHPGWPATTALQLTDTTPENLYRLVDAAWVTASHPDGRPVKTASTRAVRGIPLTALRVRIAPPGQRWAENNPHNRALMCVAEHGGHTGVQLRFAVTVADVDLPAFADLAEEGLIEARHVATGQPAQIRTSTDRTAVTVRMKKQGWKRLAT